MVQCDCSITIMSICESLSVCAYCTYSEQQSYRGPILWQMFPRTPLAFLADIFKAKQSAVSASLWVFHHLLSTLQFCWPHHLSHCTLFVPQSSRQALDSRTARSNKSETCLGASFIKRPNLPRPFRLIADLQKMLRV